MEIQKFEKVSQNYENSYLFFLLEMWVYPQFSLVFSQIREFYIFYIEFISRTSVMFPQYCVKRSQYCEKS